MIDETILIGKLKQKIEEGEKEVDKKVTAWGKKLAEFNLPDNARTKAIDEKVANDQVVSRIVSEKKAFQTTIDLIEGMQKETVGSSLENE